MLKKSPRQVSTVLFDALNSMEEALVVYGANGCLQACNRAFLEMYGYTTEEAAPGVHFRELGEIDLRHGNVVVEDEEGGDYLERKAAYRKNLKGSFTVKLQDGRWIRSTDRATPGGGFISVHVDVSDLKIAQDKIREAQFESSQHQERLAELNESLELQVAERTSELEEAKQIAEQLARTDSLTGINNRRAFFESASIIHENARRFNHGYSILMIDIDRFKQVNDSYGHVSGDLVVRELANTIIHTIRSVDIAGRIGGDDFGVILPETSAVDALFLAERLRLDFSSKSIPVNDGYLSFTISIGTAFLTETDRSLEDVIANADNALYGAKDQGRNSVFQFA